MSLVRRSIFRLSVAALTCGLALFADRGQAQAPPKTEAIIPTTGQDLDRPILRRGGPLTPAVAGASQVDIAAQKATATTGTLVAPGLSLPSSGRVWALDTFEGKPELVHLMYFPTIVDRHSASNFAKVNLAPFIAKAKLTVEVTGTRAAVRLHESNPAIFVRCTPSDNEDAAIDPSTAETHTELALVKLEVHGDNRVVNTIAFTQITGKATRSDSAIEINKDQVPNSPWQKITPKEPLAPGEYGLVALPKGKYLAPTIIFEFAIDPKAPQNRGILLPEN